MISAHRAGDRGPLPGPLFFGASIYRGSSYGRHHPLRVPRVSTVMDLGAALGWLPPDRTRISPRAKPAALTAYHTPTYIAALQRAEESGQVDDATRIRHNLGTASNPIFPEMFRRPATGAGGVMLAAELLRRVWGSAGVLAVAAGGPDRVGARGRRAGAGRGTRCSRRAAKPYARAAERAGLLKWRQKIDQRLHELDLLDDAARQPPADDVRISARQVNDQLRIKAREHLRERAVELREVLVVPGPVRQRNVEIAEGLGERIIVLAMQGQGEHRIIIRENRGRAIALMDIEIDDCDPRCAPLGLHQPRRDRGRGAARRAARRAAKGSA